MSTIRVDYVNARTQAKKLQSAASECEDVVRNLRSLMDRTSTYWEGVAADTFRLALQKRIQEVQKIRDQSEQMAVLIRRVADEFEETERRMKEMLASTTQTDSFATSTPSNGDGAGGGFSSSAGLGGGGSNGGGF